MTPRRSVVRTRTPTTTASAISAWCGTLNLGWTAASQPGRSLLRAIASDVRPIPAISPSSAPRLASAAPTLTTGTAQAAPTASTAVATGAPEAAIRSGPRASSRVIPTSR